MTLACFFGGLSSPIRTIKKGEADASQGTWDIDLCPHPIWDASKAQWTLPRPKNMPPACFLDGLSSPIRTIK